jgi:hypothetical protein
MSVRRFATLAALLTVTACGVQPTGVINAGRAPVIPDNSNSSDYVVLYFLVDGRLTGMSRQTSTSTTIATALDQLLQGPTSAERATGATTLLPATSAKVSVSTIQVPTVTVPFPVLQLPELAISQLACTTLATVRPTNGSESAINLIGTDGKAWSRQCFP